MKTLNKQQLLDICYGAGFLGSGGGGPLKTALRLLENLPDDVTVNVNTVEEVGNDKRTAVVAFMGAPEKMLKIQNSQSAIAAFDGLNKEYSGQIGYVMPIEIGALNTIAPILVAIEKGIPVIDGDGAGRAIPAITMTTFAALKLSANPTVLANSQGQAVSVFVGDASQAESCCRPILEVFDQEAGLAMWAMDKLNLQQAITIRGTLQLSEDVGHILRTSIEPIDDVLKLLENRGLTARRLFTGIVQPPEEETQVGFDYGQVILRDDQSNQEVWVYYQNENLIAWDTQIPTPIFIAPDSLCYVTLEGKPFSNADIDDQIVHHKATLIGIVARPELQTDSILESFKKALQNLGYAGSYLQIPYLQDIGLMIKSVSKESANSLI